MSQHATKLYTLLVEDIYGDLASRVFEVLAINGRLSIPAILPLSSLTPKQVKNGLAVLIQQHLVLWYTASEDSETYYEANSRSAYEIIRTGKFIQLIVDKFGEFAGQVFIDIISSGHAEVRHLAKLYKFVQHGTGQSQSDTKSSFEKGPETSHEPTLEFFHLTLGRLIHAGFLSAVHESHFRSEADNRSEAAKELRTLAEFKYELKGELKLRFETELEKKLISWRFNTELNENLIREVRSLPFHKKQQLQNASDEDETAGKRTHFTAINDCSNHVKGYVSHAKGSIDSSTVLRAQFDKYTVAARNERLVDLAKECVSEVTSQVYAELLRRVEGNIRCCNLNSKASRDPDEDPLPQNNPGVSTNELAKALQDNVDIEGSIMDVEFDLTNSPPASTSMKRSRKSADDKPNIVRKGKAKSKAISKGLPTASEVAEPDGMATTEMVIKNDDSDQDDYIANNDDNSMASESDFELDQTESPRSRKRIRTSTGKNTAVNGKGTEATLESDGEDFHTENSGSRSQAETIRQHLLLLAEHPFHFVHHVRRMPDAPERWTVNFAALSRQLQKKELEETIFARYEKEGLRIVRILQEKGKLEEKAIGDFGLMNQKIMRSTLNKMHIAGHLELQEVPRDTQRQISKIIHLWHYDQERCSQKVLEETYQTMARFMQRIKVERERAKIVIEKSERSDVKGREDELLTPGERKELDNWKKKEEMLLVQLGRLDDLVAVLRDF